jgi:transcriptional regulator with XRE-family HTH domain
MPAKPTINLRQLREQRGFTQQQLANKSGLASSQISNIECGQREPSLKSLRKLRRALRCTWDELLG